MDPFEFVLALVLIIMIFSVINGFLKRKYGVVEKRAKHRTRGKVDNASSALLEIEQMKQGERAEARKMYESLAREKMEVIKTALTMGYADLELKKLDERLERLVGPEKLTQLLDESPTVQLNDVDLMDEDLQAEIERLQQNRQAN